MAEPTAGVTLKAVAALARQWAFTREQVVYLMALAYDSGRTAAYREDLAELHSVWEDRAERRRTYAQVVARRHAEMAESAAREARYRASRPQPLRNLLDGMEWPAVAAPGSGRPAEWEGQCPCPRTGPRTEEHPSGHVVGWTPRTERRAA